MTNLSNIIALAAATIFLAAIVGYVAWRGLVALRKVGTFFLLFAVGMVFYGGSKGFWRSVNFPRTDLHVAYLTDNNSRVWSTNFVHLAFTPASIVPPDAQIYLDYRAAASTNDEDWVTYTNATLAAFPNPLDFEFENATNYSWMCYTTWTPSAVVVTNGTVRIGWLLPTDGRTNTVVMLRTAIAHPYVRAVCFTAKAANSVVQMFRGADAPDVSLESSRDGATWTPFVPGQTSITLESVGDFVYLRAGAYGNSRFTTEQNNNVWNVTAQKCKFDLTVGRLAVSGDLTALLSRNRVLYSLFDGTNFAHLFASCTALVSAEGLELPSRYVNSHCYTAMFMSCTRLAKPPKIAATTLSERSCFRMFSGCTALDTAPELKATTMARRCYWLMFTNCKNLTRAPELVATSLDIECYKQMFEGCTGIESVTTHQVTFGDITGTDDWLKNVGTYGTFYCPAALGTQDTIYRGEDGCPELWTVVNIE